MIRNLRRDELIPESEPRRYRNAAGYIRLRWQVGKREYVEDFEHRIIMGRPKGHVHHKNHDPSDNRIENLVILSEEEHSRLHAEERSVHYMHTEMVDLYMSGLSTVQIGKQLGVSNSTVSRALKHKGVKARTSRDYATSIDADLIRRWHAEGVRADEMVRRTGAARTRIDQALDELGLPRFRAGTPGRKRE